MIIDVENLAFNVLYFIKCHPMRLCFQKARMHWISNILLTIHLSNFKFGISPEILTFLVPEFHLTRIALWATVIDVCMIEELVYGGQSVNEEMIFGRCGAIVFVIDAQVHEIIIQLYREK